MEKFKITVKNTFRQPDQKLVVFNSKTQTQNTLDMDVEQLIEIDKTTEQEPENYLLISVSPESGDLPSSQVVLPSASVVEFIPDDKKSVQFSNLNSVPRLIIPEGAANWQLRVAVPKLQTTSTTQSTPPGGISAPTDYDDGPDNVTVGEDGAGG